MNKPNLLKFEKALYKDGINLVAGIDEAGRGPLIGPVVAAAVILPKNFKLNGLNDSKQLTEKQRDIFYAYINEHALAIGIGIIDYDVIDEVNIYKATILAMEEAVNNLSLKPEHLLIDAMKLNLNIPYTSIIKGDSLSLSIAAASVIAKVTRDKLMYELDLLYPMYNFKSNKGYPTKEHIKAIEQYGILSNHRKTYGPVKEYLNK